MSQYIRPPHDRPLPRSRHVAPGYVAPIWAREKLVALPPRRRRRIGRRLLRGLMGCMPAVWPGLALIPLAALLASWWLGVL